MAWSRFEPGFSRHVKRVKCGPLASWLWACSVDHCTEFRTDGFLDEAAIPGLCAAIRGAQLSRCIEALVAVKSWVPIEGGYVVYGYLEHNVTAERIEKDRRASRQRYERWQDKRRSNAVTNASSTPLQTEQSNATPTLLSVGRSVGQSSSTPLSPPNGHEAGDSRGQPRRGRRPTKPGEPVAAVAWTRVMAAVRAGAGSLPEFQDAKVRPTLEAMGGWRRVSHLNGRDVEEVTVATVRKEFMQLYAALESTP